MTPERRKKRTNARQTRKKSRKKVVMPKHQSQYADIPIERPRPITPSLVLAPTEDNPRVSAPIKQRGHASRIEQLFWRVRGVFAGAIWIFIVVKLFVFDVDSYLLAIYAPHFAWLLDYKLVFFLLVLVVLLFFGSRLTLAKWLAFVVFYPFIVVFWYLPKLLYNGGNWLLPFLLLNILITILQSIRYHVIVWSLWIIGLVIAVFMDNPILLGSSILLLLILTTIAYSEQFLGIFRTRPLQRAYEQIVVAVENFVRSQNRRTDDLREPRSDWNSAQLQKWSSNLETAVMFNRVSLFIAKRLRDYQRSNFGIAAGVLTILLFIIGTTLTFAAINRALFTIEPDFYSTTGPIGFFSFLYYSFNALVFSSIGEIIPTHPLSQAVSMMESFFALVLGAIFITLIISVRGQRESEELTGIIAIFEERGANMEEYIRQEFEVPTIDHALRELEKLKSSAIKLLAFFTSQLK